jgi:hypothetical protein
MLHVFSTVEYKDVNKSNIDLKELKALIYSKIEQKITSNIPVYIYDEELVYILKLILLVD